MSLLNSPAMQQFLANISQFPTVIFTALLMFVSLYWLVAVLGLVDMDDAIGGEGGEIGGDSHHGEIGLFSAILMRFGLQDVPLLIILTLFSVIGWVLSYLNMALLSQFVTQGMTHTLLAAISLFAIAIVSLALTGVIVAPIRKRLAQQPTTSSHTLIGELATVRTMTVDDTHGEAVLNDGGAGLILKVRAIGETFSEGDTVILVEYLVESNAYRVIGARK